MSDPVRTLHRKGAEIRVFADADALVDATAAEFIEVQRAGECHVALAGGSTPEVLYRRLAGAEGATWDRTHVWFGDERCVAPDHVDSNFKMADRALLGRVAIAPDHVHRMRGEIAPQDAAAQYETELRGAFGDVPVPRFDLVLLGIGEDGHTASLFPATTAVDERERWCVANHVANPGAWRITLTFPVLCGAKRVWIFAVGSRKISILRDVLGDVHDSERWPVQRVVPSTGTLVWWLDEAAATELS